jgi:hypothetical protein
MTFRCRCGFETVVAPQYGMEIVSVYHLHEHKRLDKHADAARMEPVRSLAGEFVESGAGVLTSVDAS